MKKKGLIISTVVMVVVLIASLTTATYAWFTSSATANISEMTVETTASHGISIATFDGTNYYNGNVTLNDTVAKGVPGVWTGTEIGQGSSLAFNTANMAVYGTSGNGFSMLTAGEVDGSVVGSKAEKVYRATENYDYFAATLALQNTESTEAAQDVVAKIKFKANGPMATAARIGVFAFTGTGDPAAADLTDSTKWAEKFVLAPFGKASQSGATWINTGSTTPNYLTATTFPTDYTTEVAIADTNTDSEFANLIVDENAYVAETEYGNTIADGTAIGSLQNQGDLLYIRLVLWYEGTDAQCVAANAGTGITISIEFTKVEATVEP